MCVQCSADACREQWNENWGVGGHGLSLSGPLAQTPQQLHEIHKLLRAHIGMTAETSARLSDELSAAYIELGRSDDFRGCWDAMHTACGDTVPHHHHGGGGGGGNISACFTCAAKHTATVGVNCSSDEIGDICAPQPHDWQPPCNCSAESAYYSTMHAGKALTPYPPGIGAWYSTPAQGECLDGASLGEGGCTFKVLPRATIGYGAQFVARGFTKPTGKQVQGQVRNPHLILLILT